MAASDPTPTPDLGNETLVQFLARVEWSVNPTNQNDEDDTYQKLKTCVVALFWRQTRAYWEYVNEAFACRQSTPLGIKAAAAQTAHWRATDDNGTELTETAIDAQGGIPTPNMLFTCNGTGIDDTNESQFLVDEPSNDAGNNVYSVVNARGRDGTSGAMILGLRPSANKWYVNQVYDSTIVLGSEVLFSMNVVVEWPQANTGVVLAKIQDKTTATESAGQMLWEFGLGEGISSDTNKDPQNWVLYLRFRNSDFNSVLYQARNGIGSPIGITSGREFTLAFALYDTGVPDTFDVKFFVNGVKLGSTQSVFEGGVPTAGFSTDIRLHVGSSSLGDKYCGGPVNNVYISTAIDKDDDHDGIANALYQLGAGYP